jgi:hypothetical protein
MKKKLGPRITRINTNEEIELPMDTFDVGQVSIRVH